MEPIKKLFQNSFFSEIVQRKKRLELLQKKIVPFFPKELVPFIEIKNQIGQTLIVEIESSAVAYKIKLHEKGILDAINLKIGFNSINKIKTRISIKNKFISSTSPTKQSINRLSRLTTSLKDSPLKLALKKLIKTKK